MRLWPNGQINHNFNGRWQCAIEQYEKGFDNYSCVSPLLSSEELAELDAVIQAIAWERREVSTGDHFGVHNHMFEDVSRR